MNTMCRNRPISERRATALERGCRSALGDRLRTVAYVEGDAVVRLYRRGDLAAGVDDGDLALADPTEMAGDDAVADGGRPAADRVFRTRLPAGEGRVVVTSDGDRMKREPELRAVVDGLFGRR